MLHVAVSNQYVRPYTNSKKGKHLVTLFQIMENGSRCQKEQATNRPNVKFDMPLPGKIAMSESLGPLQALHYKPNNNMVQ